LEKNKYRGFREKWVARLRDMDEQGDHNGYVSTEEFASYLSELTGKPVTEILEHYWSDREVDTTHDFYKISELISIAFSSGVSDMNTEETEKFLKAFDIKTQVDDLLTINPSRITELHFNDFAFE